MADNNPDLQVADASDGGYDIKIGDKKTFDKAYDKWAKKNGIKTGWNNKMMNYKSEATLQKEGDAKKRPTRAKSKKAN
jgi:hypothetical protein